MLGLPSPLLSLALQVSAATLAVVSLFPKSEPVVDVRLFSEGHRIDLEISKPPLAALADTYYEYDPAQKSGGAHPVMVAEAHAIQLQPLKLDVSDIVVEQNSRILAHESLEQIAPGSAPPEEIGFSRRGVVNSPAQAKARTLNTVLSTLATTPSKELMKSPPKETVGEIFRPRAAAKVKEPKDEVEMFESAHGFRDLAREIAGKIEFKPGLALTSSTDQLVVYRQVRGERLDYGHVFYSRGEFAIYVSELRGDLVGELQNDHGQVLGRGVVSLDKIYTDRRMVTNLSLFLEPVRTGFGGLVYDWSAALRSGKFSPLKGARVDYLGFADFVRTMPDGSFLDVDVVPGSQTLIQVFSDGYMPTMGYLQEGFGKELPLVKQEYFEELFPLASRARKQTPQEAGYVIGRVLADGKPKSGAQVSMLEGLKIKPVYLDEKGRPESRQDQTGASGFFVLPEIPPGLAAVRVSTGGPNSETRVLPVGEAAVTYLEVDTQRTQDVQVSYRSFPGDALTAMVTRTLASDELVPPQQHVVGNLRVSPGADPLFIVADGDQDFEPMTYTALRESSNLELPVLKTDWVQGLYQKVGKIQLDFAGQVLGWIGAKSSFVVDVDHLEGEVPTAEVVYLDSKGEILAGAKEGVVGGSYILLNVGEGLRRVRVYYSSGEHSSCLAYLEAGTTAACAY